MGVMAKGIPRGCQGLFTPVSLGYPLSVFIKNSTLKKKSLNKERKKESVFGRFKEKERVIMLGIARGDLIH